MQHDLLLDGASRIGHRLVQNADWNGNACSWQVRVPGPTVLGHRATTLKPAPGHLYGGTAGISLFLAELFRKNPDSALRRTVRAGLRAAAREGDRLDNSAFGFYTGRVGIAYAAARAAEVLGTEEELAMAQRLLDPLEGQEGDDQALDVIGGAAGAIPALLVLSDYLENDRYIEIAQALAEHLLRTAHRGPRGWSWQTGLHGAQVRHLCGLAHGTCGIGHALLTLYLRVGDARFRFAAEQAFAYEREFFVATLGNWPDLRHKGVADYLYEGRSGELRSRVRAGLPWPDYEVSYMRTWCHGAPGIALTRLFAADVLKHPVYLSEAEASLASTVESLPGISYNYSLCHGLGGNAEPLLLGATLLNREDLQEQVANWALRAYEQYELGGRPWPCGHLQQASDASLMLGEAGIGYFFLRTADSLTPSVLLLTGSKGETPSIFHDDQKIAAEIRHYESSYFTRSEEIFACLGREVVIRRSERMPSDVDILHQRADEISAAIALVRDDSRRALLADAFVFDRARLARAESIRDLSAELKSAYLFATPDDVLADREVSVSPLAHVVCSRFDWDEWLQADPDARPPVPKALECHYLLMQRDGRIYVQRIRAFAAATLNACRLPGNLESIVGRVAAMLRTDEELDPLRLALQVRSQLCEAVAAGIVILHAGRCEEGQWDGGVVGAY